MYGWQDSISIGCGSRLPGGRHFRTLVIQTSSRVIPIPSEQLGQQPAGAADERQALAVLLGAGRLADEHQVGVGVAAPKTTLVRVSESGQRVQAEASR